MSFGEAAGASAASTRDKNEGRCDSGDAPNSVSRSPTPRIFTGGSSLNRFANIGFFIILERNLILY